MTRLAEALRRAGPAAAAPEPTTGVSPVENLATVDAWRGAADRTGLSAEPSFEAFRGFHPSALPKLVVGPNTHAATVEQYRKLGAALHHLQVLRGSRVVM